MKKLMIAAALAAVSVGAMADEAEVEYVGLYKFTASLKTTKEASKTSKETFYINLGWKLDEGAPITEAVVWWKDAALFDWSKISDKYADGKYPDNGEVLAKKDVQELIRAYAANDAADVSDACVCESLEAFLEEIGYDKTSSDAAKKNNYLGSYNIKDPKNGKWCSQFTVKKTLEDCYRKAGSQKINALVVSALDCCEDVWSYVRVDKFLSWKGGKDPDDIDSYVDKHVSLEENTFAFTKYFRFGDVTAPKATKVEVLGQIGDDFNTVGCFAFGGQGTRETKDATKLIKSLSGSIIGTLANPWCYKCCDGGTYACYFSCANDKYSDMDPDAEPTSDSDGTVAYGTFNLKLFKTELVVAE